MNKKYHIVLTTIYEPKVLLKYYENILKYNWMSEVKLWVIADKKTPIEAKYIVNKICLDGLESVFVDLNMQQTWGMKFPDFYNSLPFNNDTRRNIGYLMALEDGCEILISIDDDNWPTDDDFIGYHNISNKYISEVIVEKSGFYNVCEHINFEPSREIYPRGYPFKLRDYKNTNQYKPNISKKIGINGGLWLESPDIDATTWLNGTVKGLSYNGPDSFYLDNNTWSPINTQNTSVIRELIPYYFCVPMGYPVPGGIIHRYGDIWGGYLFLAIIQGSEFISSFGRPIASHIRNPHDYLTDLRQEFWGILLTDWLLEKIKDIQYPPELSLKQRSYILIDKINELTHSSLPTWCPLEVKNFILETTKNFKIYIDTAHKLL
jgi:hypothetical protein